jgi:hypothetical protein
MLTVYKLNMNTYLKSALIAISASFLGLTICTQVRSQVRWDLTEPTSLEFQSFFKMPMGAKGFEVSEKVLQASGQKVRLTGFMVKNEIPTPGAFILSPRPVQMSEHADGDANDLPASVCWVYLDTSQKSWVVPHISGPVTVEGLFSFKRVEAADGSVAWFHLKLAPDAISVVHIEDVAIHQTKNLQHSHSH